MHINLKNIRLAEEKTLYEFAEFLEICPSYLSEIENGKKLPSMKKLQLFADKLNIPVTKLISAK